MSGPHVPNQFIVSWKPEFVWNGAETGFLQTLAQFNAAKGCRVVSSTSYSAAHLTQVLEFDPQKTSLLTALQRYVDSGYVKYAQPNFIVSAVGDGSIKRHRPHGHAPPRPRSTTMQSMMMNQPDR